VSDPIKAEVIEEEKDSVINERVKGLVDYIDERFGGKIDVSDQNGDAQREKEVFVSRSIAALVLSTYAGVNDLVSAESITDGFDDLGIDGVLYQSEKKILYFIQSKFIKNGTSGVKLKEVATFVAGLRQVSKVDYTGANKKLLSKKDEIRAGFKGPKEVRFIVAHSGSKAQTDVSMQPLSSFTEEMNEFMKDENEEIFSFEEVDLNELLSYIVDPAKSAVMETVPVSDWNVIKTPNPVYYGLVEVNLFKKWSANHGRRLFSENIRNFLGKTTEVNSEIIKTLKTAPLNFHMLNNGVTILCDEVEEDYPFGLQHTSINLVCKNLRIINGAQTVGTIVSYLNESGANLLNSKVFIRVISLKGMGKELGLEITKATNHQNYIEMKDFASMDETQIKLERELFQKYGLRYLRLRGEDTLTKDDKKILPEDAASGLACFKDDVRVSTNVNREKGAVWTSIGTKNGLYSKLFGSATPEVTMNSVCCLLKIREKLKEVKPKNDREESFKDSCDHFLTHMVFSSFDEKVSKYFISQDKRKDIEKHVDSVFDEFYNTAFEAVNAGEFQKYQPSRIFTMVTKGEVLKKAILKLHADKAKKPDDEAKT